MSVFRDRVLVTGLLGVWLGTGFVSSQGQSTSTWITVEGGNWQTATNWSPAVIPNGGSNIVDFSTLALPADMFVNITNNASVAGFRFGDIDGTPNTIKIDSGTNAAFVLSGPAGSEVPIHVENGQAAIFNRINFSTSSGTRKTGNGNLSLAFGNNLYGTNGIILEAGITSYASNNNTIFQNSPIVFEGGALEWPFGASGLTPAQVLTVSPAGGTLILTNGVASYRLNSANLLRGTGTLVVRGGGLFFLAGVQSNFAGTLSLQGNTTLLVGLGTNYSMATGTIHVSEGSTFRLQKGTVLQISRLTGTGQVAEAGSGATSGLIVGDDGAAPFSFVYLGTNNVQLNLTKTGTSTMVWSGTNAHFGTTTIGQGTMIANGQHMGSIGTYTVLVAGTLGGTGRISRNVTTIGSIAPGYGGIGTLTVSNAVWNEGAAWSFQLGAPGVSDRLACLGSFSKGTGSEFLFDFQNTGVAGVYTIVTWAASTTFSEGDFLMDNVPSGLTPSLSIGSKELVLTLTGGAGSPVLGVSPASLDFGGVEVGSSTSLALIVTNSGSGLLTGTAAMVGGAPFSISSGGAYSLAAGESTNVVVIFAPASPDVFADSVQFVSDGGSLGGSVGGAGYLVVTATNSAILVTNGLVGLQFELTSGGVYRVQAATNLIIGADWMDITLPLTNRTGASIVFSDTNSVTLPGRAYRIQSP